MRDAPKLETEQQLNDCLDPELLTKTGISVNVLNRTRDIVVKIETPVYLDSLTWEGRGDRILLFWRQSRSLKRYSEDEIRYDFIYSVFTRIVSLPCDVEFSNSVSILSGCQLVLCLPKQVSTLDREMIFSSPPRLENCLK